MLFVSLLLAGLAIAISATALAIAVAQDLRERDRRVRSQLRGTLIPLHAAQSTLRVWGASALPEIDRPTAPPRAFLPSPGPDIVVGHPPLASAAVAAEGRDQRKAA